MFLAVVIGCGGGEPAPSADAKPAAATASTKVNVLISGMGYSPARIEGKAGQKMTLVFDRPDAANCGEKVVFPATGREVDVPVGKKVEVDIELPESGEVAFTCGMAMYEGAVVVTGS
jgi:Cu+-exporting ATPase